MRMKRWSVETTFEEGRAHLGIETQRQWSDRAIERTTPLLFGLSVLWLSLDRLWRPMGILLTGKQPGITNQQPPLAIFWRWCAGACGVISLSPHPVRPRCRFSAACDTCAACSCGVLLSKNAQSRVEDVEPVRDTPKDRFGMGGT